MASRKSKCDITPILNKDKRSIVLSMILGDGSIAWSKNYNSSTGYLEMKHSAAQADWLVWKTQRLEEVFEKPITIHQSGSYVDTYKKVYPQVRSKLGMKRFRSWRKIFYKNNKKNLAPILQFIQNPTFAMMIWLGDDGGIRTQRIKSKDPQSERKFDGFNIYTCDQYLEDIEKCKEWINLHFNVKCKTYIHRTKWKGQLKEYPIVKINKTDSIKIWSVIRETLLSIPSMAHKFRSAEQYYQELLLQTPARITA